MNKTLIFEGAGWAGADTSRGTNVLNCRIRTRIRNNSGRLIYLEMGGTHFDKKQKHYIPKYAQGLEYATHIDHLFYDDAKWDKRRNFSRSLSPLTNVNFEYNKANIIKFVNEKLDCSFDDMEVINEGLRVFDTENPLCNSTDKEFEPFEDIEININTLDGIKPILDYKSRGFAQYRISYDYIKKLPYLNKWMSERSQQEQLKFPHYNYIASLRWDNKGIITELEITARQNFCCMGLSVEDLQSVIDEIKKVNKEVLTA